MAQQQEPFRAPIIGGNKIIDESHLPRITCVDIFSMILNFITWIFIILIIFEEKKEDGNVILFSVLGVVSYLLYFINEFYSTTFIYLKTKDNKIINEKMGDVYKANPSINLVGVCYHFAQRYFGNSIRTETIISHQEKIEFNYSFCRDVSGNFHLNINKNNYKCKYYVILKVKYEIIFDDDLLFKEYNDLKNEIINRNRNRDSYFKYKDNIEINGISNINIIKLNEKEPWFIDI